MMFLKSEKADAELVGHIIILSLTITGISIITLAGIPAISHLQDMTTVRNIEQAYTVFDSRASKVALGDAPMQVIRVDTGGGTVSVVPNSSSEDSYILFELKNGTDTITSIEIPMGKIVYTMGDREVAYEGGGVWSRYPEGSVMLSPPEFNYNGVTMTFPVINISGISSISGKGTSYLKIEKKGSPEMIYPNDTYRNPLPDNVSQVSFTIKSEYYDAWADYFRSLDLVTVNSSEDEKKVTVSLETPSLITNFSYGALASDEIEIKNNAEIDSYDSSIGPYAVSRSGNGNIRAAKKIKICHGAVVNGSALTGDGVPGGLIKGCGTITKDAYAWSFGSVTVLGNKYPPVEVLSVGSTTNLVQSRINEYKVSNNNNDSACLSGAGNTILDGSGWETCTISSGNYYLTKFELGNNDNLIFNTQDGAVNIAVEAKMELNNNVNITVNGDNPVRIYLNREIELGNNVMVNPTTGDKSSLFQIISSDSNEIEISNNAEYCGFIWAPEAEIEIENNAQVYGAMVGKKFELENNQQMHYDEALKNLNTVETGTAVRYIYITRSDVAATIS